MSPTCHKLNQFCVYALALSQLIQGLLMDMSHLLVCSGLEATFADNHREGEEAQVVIGAGS